MARCQVKTGFMVLRDCENAADEQCSVCGNFVCEKHKRSHPQAPVCCIDCYARLLDGEQAKVASADGKNADQNHCCSCGIEVFSKLGSENPQNKVIDPDTMQVFCQECYDASEGKNTSRLVGAALLSRSMYDDDYWYGYRSRYYHTRHYHPYSHGENKSVFGEDEVRAFNPKNNPQENGQLDDSNNKDNVFDS